MNATEVMDHKSKSVKHKRVTVLSLRKQRRGSVEGENKREEKWVTKRERTRRAQQTKVGSKQ